jgi:MerR family copper efflux transcriptional regulator
MVNGLTINEAALTTGWSARMLRYVESAGLVSPARTEAGYRIYGPGELQRLATLKELLDRHDITLSDVAFARRLDTDEMLEADVREWLEAEPRRPADVEPGQWLSFEQLRHERLLSRAA